LLTGIILVVVGCRLWFMYESCHANQHSIWWSDNHVVRACNGNTNLFGDIFIDIYYGTACDPLFLPTEFGYYIGDCCLGNL